MRTRLSPRSGPTRVRIVRACLMGLTGADTKRFSVIVEALRVRGEYGSVRAIALRHGVSPSSLFRWLKRADSVVRATVRVDESSQKTAQDG